MKGAAVALVLVALLAFVAIEAVAQPEAQPENDQERLQRERAEQLRNLAQQGPMGQVIAITGDGRGGFTRFGPGAEQIPEQIILTGATEHVVYIVRGFMIYRYDANPELALVAEVDMRTEDEAQRMEQAQGQMIWPDPAMVPVKAEFAPNSNTLVVLRGGYLLQFSADLDLLAEFDLRTEAEKNRPRVQMRMGPVVQPPAEVPPPPPQQ